MRREYRTGRDDGNSRLATSAIPVTARKIVGSHYGRRSAGKQEIGAGLRWVWVLCAAALEPQTLMPALLLCRDFMPSIPSNI